MIRCSWCNQEYADMIGHIITNPICAAMFSAQLDESPIEVQTAALVLRKWIEEVYWKSRVSEHQLTSRNATRAT